MWRLTRGMLHVRFATMSSDTRKGRQNMRYALLLAIGLGALLLLAAIVFGTSVAEELGRKAIEVGAVS